MKRICFITTISLTLETFVMPLINYLHENTDWDISVICDEDKGFEERLPKFVHYFPVSMKRGISIAGIRAFRQIKKIFRREKFELIQYSTPNASFYAALAGKMAGVPVRLYCQWGMAYVGFQGMKRRIFKTVEKITCKLSTWIEPDSKSNLEFAHEEGLYPREKGSVIWNGSACGIDFKKFDITRKNEYRSEIREKLKIPMNAVVFGFVGRITRDKGVNELLTSFRNMSEQNDNIYLMMVGADESDSTVDAELFGWSKSFERIIYTGFTKVVEQYLSAMDIYVLPSYREGFGMGVVEAEAMGVPVIVTKIPGPIDAMKEDVTGLVVKKADAESLEEAMQYMVLNEEMLRKFGAKGNEFALNMFEQKKLFECIKLDREKMLQLD